MGKKKGNKSLVMEEVSSSDGIATVEFKRLRNMIRELCAEITHLKEENADLKETLADVLEDKEGWDEQSL